MRVGSLLVVSTTKLNPFVLLIDEFDYVFEYDTLFSIARNFFRYLSI